MGPARRRSARSRRAHASAAASRARSSCSASTQSRDFAARCDEVFDTPGTFTRLEERLHDLPYPASFRPFAGYEAEARALRMFEHVLVPGLLQTPEYARAVLATRPRTTADELETLVTARLSRQVIFDRKDPPLLFHPLGRAGHQIGPDRLRGRPPLYRPGMSDTRERRVPQFMDRGHGAGDPAGRS